MIVPIGSGMWSARLPGCSHFGGFGPAMSTGRSTSSALFSSPVAPSCFAEVLDDF